ncbi:radical SAM protein [Lentzea sp. NPDC004782]|uniref:radical SAM protein n=1 Tax=Lentzea sp. NPDC004782 TaxID=3154458 RepID=UPI0033A10932
MRTLIASPFLGEHLVLRPDDPRAVKVGAHRYRDLLAAATRPDNVVPAWLADAARQRWDLDLAGRRLTDTVLVREPSALGYGRASYELNLGCNYDCEHCYLGVKRFEGMSWRARELVLRLMRDAGVLWLQLTGGEPTIDPLFSEVYRLAWDLGMVITLLSNGSRLHHPAILELLTSRRPYRITVSVYGATEQSYDGLTRRKGSFRLFSRGLEAACAAGLPVTLSLVITRHNEHEIDAMRTLADRYRLPFNEYSNISPTIHSGAETLPSQSAAFLRARKPFMGCGAGHTHFHVDPHGKASMCKVGRDSAVDLVTEGLDGLLRLGEIADGLMARTGGCSGCALSSTCFTCRPLARLYQESGAPLNRYCQHTGR